jgi:hypothetical protein
MGDGDDPDPRQSAIDATAEGSRARRLGCLAKPAHTSRTLRKLMSGSKAVTAGHARLAPHAGGKKLMPTGP